MASTYSDSEQLGRPSTHRHTATPSDVYQSLDSQVTKGGEADTCGRNPSSEETRKKSSLAKMIRRFHHIRLLAKKKKPDEIHINTQLPFNTTPQDHNSRQTSNETNINNTNVEILHTIYTLRTDHSHNSNHKSHIHRKREGGLFGTMWRDSVFLALVIALMCFEEATADCSTAQFSATSSSATCSPTAPLCAVPVSQFSVFSGGSLSYVSHPFKVYEYGSYRTIIGLLMPWSSTCPQWTNIRFVGATMMGLECSSSRLNVCLQWSEGYQLTCSSSALYPTLVGGYGVVLANFYQTVASPATCTSATRSPTRTPTRAPTQCSPGCPPSWIGDGVCDTSCFTPQCNYDANDCTSPPTMPSRAPTTPSRTPTKMPTSPTECSPGCPPSWIGDGACDAACFTYQCNFDGNDCSSTPTRSPTSAQCSPGCASSMIGNGQCNTACFTPQCNFDGNDCGPVVPTLSPSQGPAQPNVAVIAGAAAGAAVAGICVIAGVCFLCKRPKKSAPVVKKELPAGNPTPMTSSTTQSGPPPLNPGTSAVPTVPTVPVQPPVHVEGDHDAPYAVPVDPNHYAGDRKELMMT